MGGFSSKQKIVLFLIVVVIIIVLTVLLMKKTPSKSTSIANPASRYCLAQGGTLNITSGNALGEQGICTLPGGNIKCEEWAFFRGNCPIRAKNITSTHYCRPEEKNVDFCHDVYQLVCAYDKNNNVKEFSNGCFACKSEDIIFWKTGACKD